MRNLSVCVLWAAAEMFVALTLHAQMSDFPQRNPNRSEGTRQMKHTLPDIALVGLHSNFQTFSQNADLNVRFFLPKVPGTSDKKVFVEAEELTDSLQYYMRSKDSYFWKDGEWNTFQPWLTSDVIDRKGVKSDNIGVLAQYQSGNNPRVYLPANIYQSNPGAIQTTYTFYLHTGQDLQKVDVFVKDSTGHDAKVPIPVLKCKINFNRNCIFWPAGRTNHFDLNFAGEPPGEYNVNIVGHIPGQTAMTSFSITLYHHP